MATTQDYKSFVLEQLSLLTDIKCRPMMGEYLLYCGDILFGGIYDDRLLIKQTQNNAKYHFKEELPYQNGKAMYLVDQIDNKQALQKIVTTTCDDLSTHNTKKINNK